MAQDVRNIKIEKDEKYLIQMLKLSIIPGLGAESYKLIKSKLNGDVAALFSLKVSDLTQLGFRPNQISAIRKSHTQKIDTALAWKEQDCINEIICLEDDRYPQLLSETASPPFLLFCRGQTIRLQDAQLAVVGSRNPSLMGKQVACNLSKEAVSCGWTITSGLAMGIDAMSHSGALAAQGNTNAVLGTAINQLYPKRNVALANHILDNGGCIVSEFAPGFPTRPENFPRRNRIISGLSLGTLVVEAAIKSGSLITARYALEQNREVFAVPGNINNPLVAGCHHLIKLGAKLVEKVEDINDEFQTLSFLQHSDKEKNLKKNERQSLASDKLLDSVDYDVTAVDVVAQRSNMSISGVLAQLLQYELRGLVAAVPGGYVKLGGK